MNCEGVRNIIEKTISTTTVAERNAACVHCRTCEDCQALLLREVEAIPKEVRLRNLVAAQASLIRDRADPEWK